VWGTSHTLESEAARELGGKRARPKGERAMMNVATALVESSLAETLLVIIVALFAVMMLGVLVRQA
jgi:hypothetical protein